MEVQSRRAARLSSASASSLGCVVSSVGTGAGLLAFLFVTSLVEPTCLGWKLSTVGCLKLLLRALPT